ncbi:hypothetical protein BuS5_01193 [Desulfosarcina sp. BuS5]|uniref:transposase n=1 Tax=Desulfosarcina sp. BuS5 TaxID=933262 RepID=UPI002378B0A6|nr:transposase [Desulfosarcina sp. BuS5]WDN88225.1 hypothetical protein BuS5_01193 [Desulfosarcina sp. BuS5]
MITRNLGLRMSGNAIKKLKTEDAEELFTDSYLVFTAQQNIKTIEFLKNIIKDIEKKVLKVAELAPEFIKLKTFPGIGKILGLTIMLEVGDIKRFSKVGAYSSYCRCVKSERISNGKKKAKIIKKMGINTSPGLMLELRTLLYDSVLRHKDFISEKKQREME